MAMLVANDCLITYDGIALSGDSNSVKMEYSADAKQCTCFGDTTDIYLGGLPRTEWSINGFWNTENYITVRASPGAAKKPLSVVPNGNTAGNKALFAEVVAGAYNIGTSIDEVIPFEFTGKGTGPLVGGYLFEATTKSAAATTYTGGIQLGALASGQTLYALAQCTAITDTSPTLTVTVQSDDNGDFSSAEDRQALTEISAVGSVWQEYSTAQTDDYWRFKVVVGGTDPSVTYVLCMQIV